MAHFTESDREEDDDEEEEEEEEKVKKGRRHAVINESDLEALERSRYEALKSTIRQTKWSVRCFQTWCAEEELVVDLQTVTKVDLNQTLRRFYASVKTVKGTAYGFSSYVGLRAGLNRHIKEPPFSRSMCLLKDPEFMSSNAVFVAVLKRLRREGLRGGAFRARPLTDADLGRIVRSRALDPNTPQGLVNKVWFDVQLHMGRRANGEVNRLLKPESFSVHWDASDGCKYVTLALGEHPTKAHGRGDAAGQRDDGGRPLRGFMREQPGNPLCPVASLEKYLSLLPGDPPAFYLHPIRAASVTRDQWYTREPMGVNFLKSMLPRICKAAGTDTIYTNTCLQKTPVPKPSDAVGLVPKPSNTVGLVPKPSNAVGLVPKPSNAVGLVAKPSNTVGLVPKPSNAADLVLVLVPAPFGATPVTQACLSAAPKTTQRTVAGGANSRNILPKPQLKRTSGTESNPVVSEKRSADVTEQC